MNKILKIKQELDSNVGLYESMTTQEARIEFNVVNKPRNRTSMSRAEIYEYIDPTALKLLDALQLSQLNLALSDNVNPFGNAAQVFIDVFGSGSDTVMALAAARVETVSQATILDISGLVEDNEIIIARAH